MKKVLHVSGGHVLFFSFSSLGDVSQSFAVRLLILTQLQALLKGPSQYQQNHGCKEPGLEEEEPEVRSLLSFFMHWVRKGVKSTFFMDLKEV